MGRNAPPKGVTLLSESCAVDAEVQVKTLLPAFGDKFLVKGRELGLMFPRLIKKRPLQQGLPPQVHSLMCRPISVPAVHYICSAICSISVVTVRESLAEKGRGQGGEESLPSRQLLNP